MNLSYGSRGDEVRRLQQALQNAGYDVGATGADGIYGSNTQSAVRRYQQANGLSVDGIAGPLTQGKLYGSGGSGGISGVSQETQAGSKTQYKPTEAVKQAQKNYEAVLAGRPKTAPSDAALRAAYEALQSSALPYRAEEDPLYAQYRAQYTRLGRQAMEDTMGQAAALTGGYGSTYAQNAGQQVYGQYMQELADRLPELESAAYERQQGALQKRYAMAKAQYDAQYARYRDEVSDWQSDANRARAQLESAQSFSYQEYRDLLDYYLAQMKLENSDYRWQQEYALKAGG